jgi:hypothetical protein
MAGMALWVMEDWKNEESLYKLAEMKTPDAFVTEYWKYRCILSHKSKIPYFNSNPVKHFYDQTTQSVITLITRNKK